MEVRTLAVITLIPSGPGDLNECYQCSPGCWPGSTVNYRRVQKDDGDTTYVRNCEEAGEQRDLYKLPSTNVRGRIGKVTVYAKVRTLEVTGYAFYDILIKTHGKIYSKLVNWNEPSWSLISADYPTNPYTGLPWTWEEINNLQIGIGMHYEVIDSTLIEHRCTYMYAEVEYTPLTYTLNVNSSPISGIEFTLDGLTRTTPFSGDLEPATYTITMPPTVTVDTTKYGFDHWEDGTIDPTRTITLDSDITLTAYYVTPVEHTLTLESKPVTGVSMMVDDTSVGNTPVSLSVKEGTHSVTAPKEVEV